MMFFNKIVIVMAIALGGCYTVPETGRNSLNLVSQNLVEGMATASFEDIKKKSKISTNTEQVIQINEIGLCIIKAARQTASDLLPEQQWEFVLFDDENVVNAFALPGGKIAVYSGLFKVAKNQAQLAAIIGHEVGHIVAHHGNERLSQSLILAGLGTGLEMATSSHSKKTQIAILSAYGAGASLGVMLPFSRSHESEADYLGLIYMARAGYDPRQAIILWKNMANQSSGTNFVEFLSTHPSYQTRLARLQAVMPQALAIYEQISRSKDND